MPADTNSAMLHPAVLLASPVCGAFVSPSAVEVVSPLTAEAPWIVNSVVAVPVLETMASVCLPTDSVSR